jgi:hypothetical protein
MKAGRLAAVSLPLNVNTVVYPVPAGRRASFTVNFCNITTATAKIRLALSIGTTPQASDWIEYDTSILGNGVLERTGLALSAGQCLIVFSNKATVTSVVYGIEEDIG